MPSREFGMRLAPSTRFVPLIHKRQTEDIRGLVKNFVKCLNFPRWKVPIRQTYFAIMAHPYVPIVYTFEFRTDSWSSISCFDVLGDFLIFCNARSKNMELSLRVKKIIANRRITIREFAEEVDISYELCKDIFTAVLSTKRVEALFILKLLNF